MGTATITQWDSTANRPSQDPNAVALTVDFDPQSIELSYATMGVDSGTNTTTRGARNKTAPQQTSQSATMSVTLMFDTSTTKTSVQEKTGPLVSLTNAGKKTGPGAPPRPVVLFGWGQFAFLGYVESMTQTIDFFSDDGVPLRASIHLSLRETDLSAPGQAPGAPGGLGLSFGASIGIGANAALGASVTAEASASASVGTSPLTLSQAGDSVQAIAARSGGSVSWQAVATANGIDNPRLIPPGTMLDAGAGAQLDASAAGRIQASASASAAASAGVNGS